MDDAIRDLIDEIIFTGQKIYVAYELDNGTVASLTNGDAEFMTKVRGNVIASARPNRKPEGHNSEARRARDEGIAGNKGNVGDKGDGPVPGYAHESSEDEEVEKTFRIN